MIKSASGRVRFNVRSNEIERGDGTAYNLLKEIKNTPLKEVVLSPDEFWNLMRYTPWPDYERPAKPGPYGPLRFAGTIFGVRVFVESP